MSSFCRRRAPRCHALPSPCRHRLLPAWTAAALLTALLGGVLAAAPALGQEAATDEQDASATPPATRLLIPTGHRAGLRTAAVSPDERYVLSAGRGGSLKVWDVASGYPVAEYRHPSRRNKITAATFGPHGTYIAFAIAHGEVLVWDWAETDPPAVLPIYDLDDPAEGIKDWDHLTLSLAFAPDGRRLALGDSNGRVGVWDLQEERFRWQVRLDERILPYERGVLTGRSRLMDRASGQRYFASFIDDVVATLQRRDLDVGREMERIVQEGRDRRAGFWTLSRLDDLDVLKFILLRITDLAFRSDGEGVVAMSQAGELFRLDGTGKVVQHKDFDQYVLTGALAPNGQYAAIAMKNGSVNVYDVDREDFAWRHRVQGSEVRRVSAFGYRWTTHIRNVQVSSDGGRLLACLGETALLVDSTVRAQHPDRETTLGLQRFPQAPSADCRVAFAPSGQQFVVASSPDRLNYGFDLRWSDDGTPSQAFETVQLSPQALTVTDGGRAVLTGEALHPVWNLKTGRMQTVVETRGAARTTNDPVAQQAAVTFRPLDEGFYRYQGLQAGREVPLDRLDAFKLPPPGAATRARTALPARTLPGPQIRCTPGPLIVGRENPFFVGTCAPFLGTADGHAITHLRAFAPNSRKVGPVIELPVQDTIRGLVRTAAMHPTRLEAATGSSTGEIRVWNLGDGTLIDSMKVSGALGTLALRGEGEVTALAYGDGGDWVGAASFRSETGFADIVGLDPKRVTVAFYKKRQRFFTSSVLGAYNRKASISLSEETQGEVRTLLIDEERERSIMGTTAGQVIIADLDRKNVTARLQAHQAPIIGLALLREQDRLLSLSSAGDLKVWDASSGELIATLLTLRSQGGLHDDRGHGTERVAWMAFTPDGYYMASKGAASLVGFRREGQVFAFSQFDLRFNRPDLVLRRLNADNDALITAYRRAYLKRLERAGLTEAQLEGELRLPTVAIANRDSLPHQVESETVGVTVVAHDERHPLDRLHVWVNDVPLHGSQGLLLSGETAAAGNLRRTIPVPLTRGENRIEVSVTNRRGSESLRRAAYVRRTGPPDEPALHVVAIGVSSYRDAAWNLTYAAKDARDVANLLGGEARKEHYRDVHVHLLTDEDATRANIRALRRDLEATTIHDHVVVFAAGHGLVTDDLAYYFATHETNFDDPAAHSLAYEELEGLLDGIPARQKVLFVDACHSGEIDEDEMASLASAEVEAGDVTFRSAGPVRRTRDGGGQQSDFSMMRELFVDLDRGTGTTVMASAGGVQAALEGDAWSNGVFTYALLSGLKGGTADMDGDGVIAVSELKNHLRFEVPSLTQGLQTPTARAENISVDFPIWRVDGGATGAAQTTGSPAEQSGGRAEGGTDARDQPEVRVTRGELTSDSQTMRDGSFWTGYQIEGKRGQMLDVRLASDDFDPYLIILDPEGEVFAHNDDSDGLNARVRVGLTSDGTYTMVVVAVEADKTGAFRLETQLE